MATANHNLSDYDLDAVPDGSSFKIHLVVSQWNNSITTALCSGAMETLKSHNVKDSNIKIIIDGYGLFPYYRDKILFVPQLFFKEILLPFGVQSTQVHMNNWDDPYCENFHKFINKNKKKITDLDHIIELANPHIIQKPVNYLVEKTLKTIRLFR